MTDSKLVQGLIIAACIFLAIGIVFTFMERGRYNTDGAPSGSSRTTVTREEPEPAPAPETPVAETPVAD